VATSRTSKRCDARSLALVLLTASLGACGTSTPSPPVTAVSLADAPRRPDGVVLEPAPAIPEVDDRSGASGVVALREPLGGDAVVAVVRALFRGFEHEDADALSALVVDDAVVLGTLHQATKGAVIDLWRSKLKSFDYGHLKGSEVVRSDRIERAGYADLGTPGAPPRPPEMKPGEILVRVPVTTPRVGSEQLFGDVVVLLLRREGRAFKISGFGEESGP
jgi:hypothetical protein